MRIGILGAGLMGGKLGTIFARAGHEVVFRYAPNNDKLRKLARGAKGDARAGTPGEAAKESDALLLAVHRSRIHLLPADGFGRHATDRWNDHVGSRRTCQEGSQGSCGATIVPRDF